MSTSDAAPRGAKARDRSPGDASHSPAAVALRQRIGRLLVVAEGEPYLWRGRFSRRRWVCECECGLRTEVREDRLKAGTTLSCGCFRDDSARARALRHGGKSERRASPEYLVWQALLHRRADRVSRRWRLPKGKGFAAFLEDVGPRPSARHRLHRPDPSKAFGPGNAVWVEGLPRAGVPRRTISYRGRTMTLREAAQAAGIPYGVLCKRLERGWTPRDALARPLGTRDAADARVATAPRVS